MTNTQERKLSKFALEDLILEGLSISEIGRRMDLSRQRISFLLKRENLSETYHDIRNIIREEFEEEKNRLSLQRSSFLYTFQNLILESAKYEEKGTYETVEYMFNRKNRGKTMISPDILLELFTNYYRIKEEKGRNPMLKELQEKTSFSTLSSIQQTLKKTNLETYKSKVKKI